MLWAASVSPSRRGVFGERSIASTLGTSSGRSPEVRSFLEAFSESPDAGEEDAIGTLIDRKGGDADMLQEQRRGVQPDDGPGELISG